jgi:hypothetical protein
MQNFLFFVNYCILVPYLAFVRHAPSIVAATFLYDVGLTLIMTLLVAMKTKRYDILSAFPVIYILRWITLGVFLKAFVEVTILRRFKTTEGTWSTAGRRYKSA